jgi:hypothetical protein
LELNSLSSATNHNGGAMHYGPDDELYIVLWVTMPMALTHKLSVIC